MTVPTLERGAPVGIVDDLPEDRKETRVVVRAAGFEPVEVTLEVNAVDDLLDILLRAEVAGVVFDHRLSQQAPVPFDGATAAAACYHRLLPAILRTNYKGPVDELSIRRQRRFLPRVLDRRSTGPDIAQALAQTAAELAGVVPHDRRAQDAIVEIVDAAIDLPEPTVDVAVPAWDAVSVVTLPMALFASALPSNDPIRIRGLTMHARVNVWAPDADALFFEDVILADEPPGEFLAWPPIA